MIGQAVRHGRTQRDSRNLGNHLLKDAGAKFEALNSVAPDLNEIMSDMMLARDGSKAESAFLHISLSPARDMSDDELRKTADIVMKHFGVPDNQAALVIHEKNRLSGSGNKHAHLVLGRVGPDGGVLPSGFEKIRLETAMRIAEYEMGEPCTLGRHHASAVRWLRRSGRDDVANWLENSLGPNPDKPQSSMSPAKRQKVERVVETDMAAITMTVKSAWERSDNAQAFSAALHETGLEVSPGQKSGVFVVSFNGAEIGALDRLLKEKRAVVKNKMGDFKHGQAAKSDASNESHIQRSEPQSQRNRPIETIVAAPGTNRANRGRSDRANPADIRSPLARPKAPDDNVRGSRQKSRCLDEKQALISLDKVRLTFSTVIASQEIRTHHEPFSLYEMNMAANIIEAHSMGWHWVQTFRDDLIEKIKELKDKMLGSRVTDKYVTKNNVTNDSDHEANESYGPRFR